jgi:hypothetical protein
MPDFYQCLGPGCSSGQFHDNTYPTRRVLQCHECGFAICTLHRVPFHADETCESYDERIRVEELESTDLIAKISRQCPGPGCGWRIQKAGGCDSMTCKSRTAVCWILRRGLTKVIAGERCGFNFRWSRIAPRRGHGLLRCREFDVGLLL